MGELSDMELILTALCFTKVGYSRRSLMTLAVNDYVTSYIFGDLSVCIRFFPLSLFEWERDEYSGLQFAVVCCIIV